MTQEETRKIKHLYNRAGFGINLDIWKTLSDKPRSRHYQDLKKASEEALPLNVIDFAAPTPAERMTMPQDKRKENQKRNRTYIRTLNTAWIRQMATSSSQIREKMTFFWHDHFACRLHNVHLTQLQNNVLRTHALGKFGDLLRAVSKDPGMLQFLNNQQNRKAHPNENFAREVLELFTLGRGFYAEQDIKEAARAFTGWGFNFQGKFVFRRRQHDFGTKTFLGKKGNFDGDDILNIILDQRRTARFITEKLYCFLVNQQLDEEVVDTWSRQFYESEYDIQGLLDTIFNSDHFYEKKHIGSRIKSPVEYLVGMMRLLDISFQGEDGPLIIQKLLGQTLLQPPNVAGWPQGKAWIDSSSILLRMRLPQALIFSSELNINGKEAFAGNEDTIMVRRNLKKRFSAQIDWKPLLGYVADYSEEKKVAHMWEYCQQIDPRFDNESLINKYMRGQTKEEKYMFLMMRILCTPEFQMC